KSKKTIKEGSELIDKVRKLREVEEEKEISEINLNSVLDRTLSEHQPQLDERGIDIEVDRSEYKVKGGTLLQELFSNILENSIKHSDCGKIRIKSKSRDEYCVVTFEDDGKGIPEKIKDNIFCKGFKGDESEGSGLGMYMVKEIANNYGGDVVVKDSELGGARFDVKLKKAS
ncbi:MAG: sensor histidine kinase, partial [Thermoplasmatota archaeon]